MLNAVPVQSSARLPRALVQVADSYGLTTSPLQGWVSWTVTNNSYYEADTFRVSFAVSKLPSSNDANWFAGLTELYVKILAGFPANPSAPNASELATLIYGRVDDIEFDPVKTLITLTGRDLTAPFIDNKLTQQYQNQVASAIVSQLAASHGLPSNVTATQTVIGTYYKHDQVQIRANKSEWDFICWLAREENFVAFVDPVQGLFFGPDPRDTSNPYVIQWQAGNPPVANVTELSFSRSLTVAKGIAVTVRSPQQTRKTAVVQSYPTAPRSIQAGKSSPFGDVQPYFFTVAPNLKPVQVQSIAESLYNQIVSHTMKMKARLPADGILSVRTPVRVQGTGTAYDQVYFPRVVTREMSMDEGYVMEVEGQNTTPELQDATVPL